MKDFERITLCDEFTEEIKIEESSGKLKVYIGAYMHDGKLTVYGQDLGDILLRWFSKREYEYYYAFDEKETIRLFRAINGMEDPERALEEHFSGIDGTMKLETFCEENGIHYSLSSYL